MIRPSRKTVPKLQIRSTVVYQLEQTQQRAALRLSNLKKNINCQKHRKHEHDKEVVFNVTVTRIRFKWRRVRVSGQGYLIIIGGAVAGLWVGFIY